MQDFYFIRHAQTEANFAQIMCGGGVDTPLTSLGIEQAHQAQEIFLSHHHDIAAQHIIHSNMNRTRDTANILNKPLNLPIISYPNLKEHVVGDWEGKSWIEIANDYIGFIDPPNGEPFADFKSRIKQSFDNILKTHQMPLIVAHGGVWRAFIASYQRLPESHPQNAELFFFENKPKSDFPWEIYQCHENGLKVKVKINL